MNIDNCEQVVKGISNEDYIQLELGHIRNNRRNQNDEPFVVSFNLHIGATIISAFRIDGVDYYDMIDLKKYFKINTFPNLEDYLGDRVVFPYTNLTKGRYEENGRSVIVEEMENFSLISEFNLPYFLFYADEKHTVQLLCLYRELAAKLAFNNDMQKLYFESFCTKSGISKIKIKRILKEMEKSND